MRFYQQLGDLIGKNMAFIAPVCVAVGVLLPQVFGPVETIVPILFAFMTFQGSLNNTFRQMGEVFRHPAKLLVILGITLVAMPVVANLLASLLFSDNVNLVAGITLEYCVPVAVVSFMWVGMFGGNTALALAVILVSTLLAPFSIPASLQLMLGQSVTIDAGKMMIEMLFMVAIPALVGTLLNDLTHGWGKAKLSPVISPATRIVLVIIITSNSTSMSDQILHMNTELLCVGLFILLFAASGYLWGFVAARLMNASVQDLVTMCFDCGLRNISAGAVIAAAYFPGEVVFPVMMGTLFQQILAALFGNAIRRVVADENARAEAMLERGRAATETVADRS